MVIVGKHGVPRLIMYVYIHIYIHAYVKKNSISKKRFDVGISYKHIQEM